MNTIDRHPDYCGIYRQVKAKFDSTEHFYHGPYDETYYSMRVYETAKEIISLLRPKKVKVQQVLVAAICHDLGKTRLNARKMFGRDRLLATIGEEWKRHAALGVPLARQILEKSGHSRQFIDEVCYLIGQHDLRGAKLKERSLELAILQDADLISDIGLAGFLRPFLHSGKFRRSIADSIRYIKTEDRTGDGGLINLAVSKRLAKREMGIQKALAKEAAREIDSELLK